MAPPLKELMPHMDVLTKRYMVLKRIIQHREATKAQRKEAEALKWVLTQLVGMLREFRFGDYSPAMDELFDAEHALKE
jgi:hypothetical protein